jgi:hypothetical protein
VTDTGRQVSLEELQQIAAAGRLYLVLDACASDSSSVLAETSPALCLFDTTPHREYSSVSPYLIPVHAPVGVKLLAASGANGGIWIVANCGLEPLAAHLRDLLYAVLPDGKNYLFRYYDPRVLSAFLPTCDRSERSELFGPIAAFLIPDAAAGPTFVEHLP